MKKNKLGREEVIKISIWLAKDSTKEVLEAKKRSWAQVAAMITEECSLNKPVTPVAAKQFCEEIGINVISIREACSSNGKVAELTKRVEELEAAVAELMDLVGGIDK